MPNCIFLLSRLGCFFSISSYSNSPFDPLVLVTLNYVQNVVVLNEVDLLLMWTKLVEDFLINS